MKRFAALLVLCLGFLYGVSASSGAPDPSTCSGYAETRQFVDAQSWWTRTPGKSGSDFGHLHVGGCIPERETVSGTIPLDIRVVLHDNPGRLLPVSVVVKTTASETTVAKLAVPSGFSCPVGTCTLWLHYDLDTARFDRSGLQEIRYRAFVDEPDGNRMIASLNYQLYVANGKTASNVTRLPYPRGKGWYTGAGYCEARLTTVPIPDGVLSSWTPNVWARWHGESNDLRVTGHDVRLDADFHAGVQGTILKQGAGEYEGPVQTGTLSPGPHKLLIKTSCDDPRGSTNAGILVINFNGSGETEPPPPPPPPNNGGPTISILSPTSGATLSGVVRFNASASDSDGVSYVAYIVGGVELGRDSTCCDWSEDGDTRRVPNGQTTLTTRAVDKLGNVAESTIPVTVANP